MSRIVATPSRRASLLKPLFPVLLLVAAFFLNLASCSSEREEPAPPDVPEMTPPADPALTPPGVAGVVPAEPVGTLDVGEGAWVKLFTTLPGSKGKPATNVHTVTGEVSVYEVYDWAEHAPELAGETNHRWYRVDPEAGQWIFGLPQFSYTANR